MEAVFLNCIQAISDSRFWLGPLLLVCVAGIFIGELWSISDEIRDNDEYGMMNDE